MNTSIVKAVQRCCGWFGFELVPQWRRPNMELTAHLQHLFAMMDIRCVLDVGANKGQYRDFLRHSVGYTGLILSFEPIPALADSLQRRAGSDPNWEIFPVALGSSDTALTLNVMSQSEFSSFLVPDHSLVQQFGTMNHVDHQETVTVMRLDTVMNTLANRHDLCNLYLKLDTQGYDLEVIRGASTTLERVLALQSEVSVRRIYSDMPDMASAISALQGRGFDVTGLFPVNRDATLRVIEFDCVAIKNSAAERALASHGVAVS